MKLKDQVKVIEKVKAIEMPEFEATLVGDTQQATLNMPISDHDPLVVNTSLGVLVTLNVWCPGSRLSPSMNPPALKGQQLRVPDPKQQRTQMLLLAKYLYDMAVAGVSGFMLQELPMPSDQNENFKILNNELKRLTAKNKNINLEFRCQHQTNNMVSGSTCVLVNTKKLQVKDKTPVLAKNDPMYNRFGCYELKTVGASSELSCDIYNLHGDFAKQGAVKKFIEEKVGEGAMVCGDFNLTLANKPNIDDSPNHQVDKGRLNTLDGFYDPVSPSPEAQAEPQKKTEDKADAELPSHKKQAKQQKKTKKTPKGAFIEILKGSPADILNYMKWIAHPKIRASDIDHFKSAQSKIKNLNFGNLTKDEDVKRTLFNLVFYASKLKDGKKKVELNHFITDLSKNPENAGDLIVSALQNKELIKNTQLGFYKFFHSGFKNEAQGGRWARSTTEQLLIEINSAFKKSAESEEVLTQENSKSHSQL